MLSSSVRPATPGTPFAAAAHPTEDYFRSLVECSPDVVIVLDEDGVVRYVSPSVDLMGFTEQQLRGHHVGDFLHDDERAEALSRLRFLAEHPGSSTRSERRVRRGDGAWRVVDAVSTSLVDHPQVRGIVMQLRDISARTAAQTALRASRERLKEITEIIAEVFWVSDPDSTRMLYISPGYERIWGRSCESLYADPRSFADAIHPDDRARVADALAAKARGEAMAVEYRIAQPDGALRWIWDRGYPVRDPANGAVSHVVGVAMDITERRQTQDELKLFRELIDRSSDAIEVLDIDNLRFLDLNQTACDVLGYSRAELLTMTAFDIDPLLQDGVPKERMEQLRGVGQACFETRHRRKDGTTFPVEVNIKRVDLGRSYLVSSARDISDRRQLESAMEATIRALSNALEARDPYTAGHQQRVAQLARAIAVELGCSDDSMRGLSLAATVHDIGKIAVPAEILARPGRLTKPEFDLIKCHAQTGYEILKDVAFPWPIAEIVHQHHERYDGSGYPGGLKGEQILREARILVVADVIEAMSAHRPYRAALGLEAALQEIERGRGSAFDPEVVDAAVRLFRDRAYMLPR
ncbi:PAS domain S-box protein [Solimonas terrae]|uniref:PAS domain S-box protein n=1 Tax=Solimonas terrae TaxID=1396819 RepID=A0A6M2BUN2_9GAMM|nr:PAS domain S-box protein [Solimonas terrae]NGY06382.1 PAS domain S-box protein [Solimonas terrae]